GRGFVYVGDRKWAAPGDGRRRSKRGDSSVPSRLLRPLAGVLLLMLALLPAAPARGADDAGSRVPCEFPEADRIVAIGSVFGQYHGFRALLGEMGLIDAQGDWIGG